MNGLEAVIYIERDRAYRRDAVGTTDDTFYVAEGLLKDPQVNTISFQYDKEPIKPDADLVFIRRADYDSEFLGEVEKTHRDALHINHPSAVEKFSEKWRYFPDYKDVLSEFKMSTDGKEEMLSFMEDTRSYVLKPADLTKGGRHIEIHEEPSNHEEVLFGYEERLPDNTPYIAQRFLPGVETYGDSRVIVVNGDPITGVTRYPPNSSLIANYARGTTGGTLEAKSLEDDERELISKMQKQLLQDGAIWAGVDIMRDAATNTPYVIEINGKCPSLLNQSDRYHSKDTMQTVARDKTVQKILEAYTQTS